MDKIARQSRMNSTSKLLKSSSVNENDVMIIWVISNIKIFLEFVTYLEYLKDTFSTYIRDELSKKKGDFFYSNLVLEIKPLFL